MNDSHAAGARTPSRFRRGLRIAFLVWAVFSTSWLVSSFRTRGVDPATLQSSATVSVVNGDASLVFDSVAPTGDAALIFLCGGGVAAEAYAPLLRPIAEAGFPVFVVRLPYRLAPLDSHKQAAIERARDLIATHTEVERWVVSGHSLGGALTARLARTDFAGLSAIVLIGTTHPKEQDLSSLPIPVTKIYGSKDGVAPPERVLGNQALLPADTRWIEIEGGNHSQFGRYGKQLLDGKATIGREQQERITRSALLDALAPVDDDAEAGSRNRLR